VLGNRPGALTLRGKALALVALAASVACRGSEGRPAERPRPSLVSEVSALPAFVTPAVWRYHPPEPARVNAELALASGARVLAGRRGERWLLSKAGQLEAASVLAPEDLVGILEAPGGGYVFVGASGVSYEAHSPIAAFFRSSAPLEPLASVSSSGSAIVGIRRDRGLLRSEDGGGSWKPVGPSGPKFVSVLLGDSGHGLALAVPEALYATHDAGRTFERLTLPSVGAFGLERLPDRGFGVLAALGAFRYREGQQPALVNLQGAALGPAASELKPPRGPDAAALNDGRAATSAGNYYELRLGEKPGNWLLTSGPIEGPLLSRGVAELAGCRALRLSAFERSLAVACFRAGMESATQPIDLWLSDDGGRSFVTAPPALDGNLISFRMALGADSALLLTGVCPAYSAGSGCAPQGIARRARALAKVATGVAAAKAPKPPAFELGVAATPSLADSALSLGFSSDGRIAYAVGRRTKGGVLAVFVSRDGGRSFEAEELALPTGEEAEGEERWESSAVGVRVDALVPTEDGSVGLAVSRYRSRVWFVLDELGRVLSVSRPPEPRAVLGVAGSRALAVSPATNEVWESLDGGATFSSLGRLPIDLCSGETSCEVPLACTPYGCAIGSDISRLGWGGQAEDDAWKLPAPAAAPVDYSVPQLKTPISCALDASSWQSLEGVSELPTAFESAIGKAAWFASGSDPLRASAWVFVAPADAQQRLGRESLLAPSERGRAYALAVSDQVEGVAALRYVAPDPTSPSSHLTGVELGWLNLLEGRTRHAALADAGGYAPGDFARGPRGTQEADPALLSIAESGLYLRIHRAPADNQPTLFFDGQRVESLPAVEWPTSLGVRGSHTEMAHIDGEHVPLLLVGRGSAVLRARLQSGKPTIEGFANGALDPARFGLTQTANIAYAGARAGQVIETFDSASARAEAQLFPFRARGDVLDPPLDVPTQLSLGERPERCSPSSEAGTPRIVAPHHPGTRHPVIINDGGDTPQSFITAYAVLHGSPSAACVSAFDAEPVQLDGVALPTARAILPFGDLGHAYLFRASSQGLAVKVEYHPMSCKLDPAAEVPPEVLRAPGALVRRLR
jgi:hypothetical protein